MIWIALGALALIVLIGALPISPSGPSSQNVTSSQGDDLIAEQVKKYEIVKRTNGPGPELCSEAGTTAGFYLYAKDEQGYRHWEAIEKKDCAY
jgi:hypothetical protein